MSFDSLCRKFRFNPQPNSIRVPYDFLLNWSMQVMVAILRERHITFTAIRQTLNVSWQLHKNLCSKLNFCTQISNPSFQISESEKVEKVEEEDAKSLSWRIEKLPRGEPVSSAFRSWMGNGFPVHSGDIFHTINRLRKLKSNRRALEVWILLTFSFTRITQFSSARVLIENCGFFFFFFWKMHAMCLLKSFKE